MAITNNIIGRRAKMLIDEIKEIIVEALNLEDISPADIDDNAPLFGEGIGLDSIDILELIVEIERRFSVRITDKDKAVEIFSSVSSLSEYVESNRQ